MYRFWRLKRQKYIEMSREDFVETFKQVLIQEQKKSSKFIDEDDLNEILNTEHEEEDCRQSIFGYPSRPLYRELGFRLHEWMQERKCPILKLPDYDLLDEKNYKEQRLKIFDVITPLFQTMNSSWNDLSQDERVSSIHEILMKLGRRGLLDLLGLRKTFGSFDYWPPPRYVIENTFHARNNDKSQLTVGARALAKHCPRDKSIWWGVCTGSEQTKNTHAEEILKNILDNATWINVHQLPHDVRIVEVRQENGYGARWTSDGKSFRGFLEPQMVEGHAVGWKH